MSKGFLMKLKGFASMMIATAMLFTLLMGCATEGGQEATTQVTSTAETQAQPPKAEKLEFSAWVWTPVPITPPAEDMVAEAMNKEGWEVNVTEYFYESGGQNMWQKMDLFIASNTLPDIFDVSATEIDKVAKYESAFLDVTPYLADASKTPNLQKHLSQKMIDSAKTSVSKKNLYFPTGFDPDWQDKSIQEQYKEYFTNRKASSFIITLREDILTKLGYKFKPIADLEKEFSANNRRLTYDDVKIEPEIKTVEQFEKLLTDIKNLNLKAPDGTPVVPFGGFDPELLMMSSFAGSGWRLINGQPEGWFGGPYIKDMHVTLNRWYRNGLLDKDTYMLIKQKDKIGDKIATGKLGAWLGTWIDNERDAIKRFESSTNTRVRFITTPSYKSDLPPYEYGLEGQVNRGLIINKNYKDADKLIKYLDFLWSDKGQEILMWGKEDGVWEIKDGKKVFKDEKLWNAIKTGQKTDDNKDAAYYGLSGKSPYTLALNQNLYDTNKYYYAYSYPLVYDFQSELRRVAGEPSVGSDNSAFGAKSGPESGKVRAFFWQNSFEQYDAKIVLSKTDEEFEKNYKELMDKFNTEIDYKKAQQEMREIYNIK